MSSDDSDPVNWLEPLLRTDFFHICQKHPHLSRNECNLYCLDCPGQALCCPCTIDHRNHRMVQIRRSSYHNVIRVSEIQKVLDISGVQTYIINSARVVFLNHRPQTKPVVKPPLKTCENLCGRSLLQSYRYCSLACKLNGIRQLNQNFQPRESKRLKHARKQQQQQPAIKDATKPHFGETKPDNDEEEDCDEFWESTSALLMSPPTPPPTITNPPDKRIPNRRKGVPQRSPPL